MSDFLSGLLQFLVLLALIGSHLRCIASRLQTVDLLHGFLVALLHYLNLSFDRAKLVGFRGETGLVVRDLFSKIRDIFVLHAELAAHLPHLSFKVTDDVLVSLFLAFKVALTLMAQFLHLVHQFVDLVPKLLYLQTVILITVLASLQSAL